MIRSLDIKTPGETPVKWLGTVTALKEPRKFEFTPVVTQSSVGELFDIGTVLAKDPEKLIRSVKVDHDGQGVRHFDPSHATGLLGGGAAFDWDFGTEGIVNTMFKGSAGQTTLFRFRFDQLLGTYLKEGKAPKIDYRVDKNRVNSLWNERIKLIEKVLKGKGALGPVTIMMDEPERSFDLPMQVQCWRFIRAYSQKVQFIVASHSIFALNIPDANYIEMESGYLEASKAALALLPTWAKEKPFPKKGAS